MPEEYWYMIDKGLHGRHQWKQRRTGPDWRLCCPNYVQKGMTEEVEVFLQMYSQILKVIPRLRTFKLLQGVLYSTGVTVTPSRSRYFWTVKITFAIQLPFKWRVAGLKWNKCRTTSLTTSGQCDYEINLNGLENLIAGRHMVSVRR